MTLTGILKFDEGIKLEYSDPNWNIWGSKALIGISPNIFFKKSSWNRFAARTKLERHTCTYSSSTAVPVPVPYRTVQLYCTGTGLRTILRTNPTDQSCCPPSDLGVAFHSKISRIDP